MNKIIKKEGPLFVGREKELALLEGLTKKRTASLVVIRGRRRVGKSRLVKEFAKGKNFLQFSGLPPTEQTTAEAQRDEFSRQFQDNKLLPPRVSDWGDMLYHLGEQVKVGPYIILFDEISWMGSKDPTFLGKLKNAWDIYFSQNPEIIFILCGSISSWIEKNILSSTGFLGRISSKITLKELSLHSSIALLREQGFKGSHLEILMILAITGGVPWYIENINTNVSTQKAIQQLCFMPHGLFVDEFQYIFHDLFGRRETFYKHILEVLASGAKTLTEITNILGIGVSGRLVEYLYDLELSGFIKKHATWDIKQGQYSKLKRYRICDNYTRFYLKYIEPNREHIEQETFYIDSFLELPHWHTVLGLQFENLVLNNHHLIIEVLGLKPADILNVGPFFQNKTVRMRGCQIDYMIQTKTNVLYVCEIKISKKPIGVQVIQEVKEKIDRLSIPRGYAPIPVLIYFGEVTETLEEANYFYKMIDVSDYL